MKKMMTPAATLLMCCALLAGCSGTRASGAGSAAKGTPIFEFMGGDMHAFAQSYASAPAEAVIIRIDNGQYPEFTFTDPETVGAVFEALSAASVTKESGVYVTDRYHSVRFAMPDGSERAVSFNDKNLDFANKVYELSGAESFWKLANKLCDEAAESGMYEDAVVEKFNELTASYPAEVLLQSDPASAYPGSYYFYSIAGEPLYDGELGGASAEYISSEERAALGKDNYWYMVYSEDLLQSGMDQIWGYDVTDVSGWLKDPSPGEDPMCYHTSEGYFFVTGGMGDDGVTAFYQIENVEIGGETATVRARCARYNYFAGELFDMSSSGEKAISSAPDTINADMDFAEALELCGVSPDELGTLDFIFYPTDDGLRLQRVVPTAG